MAIRAVRVPSLRRTLLDRVDIRAHLELADSGALSDVPRSGHADGGRTYWYLTVSRLLPMDEEHRDREAFHLSLSLLNLGAEAPRRDDASAELPPAVVELLSNVSGNSEWEVEGYVDYPNTTRSVIQLPQPVEFPGFDELRGMRFVKLDGDQPRQSVVVDRFAGGLSHQVWLRATASFTSTAWQRWVRELQEISQRLVVVGEE